MFDIQPLTKDSLTEAQALAAKLFPWEDEHHAALAAAVSITEGVGFLASRGLSGVRVWCVLDAGQVVGLASLYDYRNAPEEVWLAWFGLSPEVRGRGVGGALLDWITGLARREQRSVLRLWTTVEEEYEAALQLYARRGFRPEIQAALPGESWQTVVFSLVLDGRGWRPWRGTLNGAHLCGRVVRAAA